VKLRMHLCLCVMLKKNIKRGPIQCDLLFLMGQNKKMFQLNYMAIENYQEKTCSSCFFLPIVNSKSRN